MCNERKKGHAKHKHGIQNVIKVFCNADIEKHVLFLPGPGLDSRLELILGIGELRSNYTLY